MVASSIFVTDHKGKPLIHRNYRGSISKSMISDEFSRILIENSDINEYDSSPIIIEKGITYCYVKYDDLYILGVTKSNPNVMLMLNFLYKIISIFNDYFDGLDSEVIRDNFVLIYELLDEICDFGYPQYTEYKLLKHFICIKDSNKKDKKHIDNTKQALSAITGCNIRQDGISYKKNEIFVDVIEKLNLLMTNNGNILHSEINGKINMKSYLSGIPQLTLGLNDKLKIQNRYKKRKRIQKTKTKTVELDDISFHQCVRLNRFEKDRSITFIPPDGEFELMRYRLDTDIINNKALIHVECIKDIKLNSRIIYKIKIKSLFKSRSTANNVHILIPVYQDVDTPIFNKINKSIGSIEYIPSCNYIKWSIPHLNGQKEYLMNAEFGLPSINNIELERKAPIKVEFEIPYFTVSGIQVRYLKIIEKSGYKALPWVRYITQNGDYSIRM